MMQRKSRGPRGTSSEPWRTPERLAQSTVQKAIGRFDPLAAGWAAERFPVEIRIEWLSLAD
jgi:hypothetical protein